MLFVGPEKSAELRKAKLDEGRGEAWEPAVVRPGTQLRFSEVPHMEVQGSGPQGDTFPFLSSPLAQ